MIVLLLRRHQECSFGFQESSSQSLLDKKTHCRVCSTYQQYPFSFSFMTYHSKSSRKELKQPIPFAPTPLRIPSLRNQTTSFPLLITSLRRSHRYQISQILSAYPTALAQPLLEVTLSFSFHSRSNLLPFLHPLFMETNSGIHSLLHFHTDVPISCSFKVMMDLNNNTTLHTPITILQKAFNSSFLPTTIFLLFLYQFISTSIQEQHLGSSRFFNFPKAIPTKPFLSMSPELYTFIHSTRINFFSLLSFYYTFHIHSLHIIYQIRIQ